MSIFMRFMANGPGAFIITAGLGILMANLIKVAFVPQDKSEALQYEINVEVRDEPIVERVLPPIWETVTTPPAPPKRNFDPTTIPTTKWVDIVGKLPDPNPLTIDHGIVEMIIVDTDEQPIVRIAPAMPPRATKSGHCKMQFDISPDGQPFNIAATYCTASLFRRASVKSVEKWKYNPKISNGRAVIRRGVETQITFNLADEHGRMIPE